MTVFAEEGDIFVYDHAKNQRRQVTRTTDAEKVKAKAADVLVRAKGAFREDG